MQQDLSVTDFVKGYLIEEFSHGPKLEPAIHRQVIQHLGQLHQPAAVIWWRNWFIKRRRSIINKTQYFDQVKSEVWEFHIGGYQVCEKWLKDRKGQVLSFEECSRYLYILAAMEKTREVMGRIDEVIGKFPIQ